MVRQRIKFICAALLTSSCLGCAGISSSQEIFGTVRSPDGKATVSLKNKCLNVRKTNAWEGENMDVTRHSPSLLLSRSGKPDKDIPLHGAYGRYAHQRVSRALVGDPFIKIAPDSSKAAAIAHDQVTIVDIETAKKRTLPLGFNNVSAFSWEDGNHCILVTRPRHIPKGKSYKRSFWRIKTCNPEQKTLVYQDEPAIGEYGLVPIRELISPQGRYVLFTTATRHNDNKILQKIFGRLACLDVKTGNVRKFGEEFPIGHIMGGWSGNTTAYISWIYSNYGEPEFKQRLRYQADTRRAVPIAEKKWPPKLTGWR